MISWHIKINVKTYQYFTVGTVYTWVKTANMIKADTYQHNSESQSERSTKSAKHSVVGVPQIDARAVRQHGRWWCVTSGVDLVGRGDRFPKEIGVDVTLISMSSKVSVYYVHLYIWYCLFT